MFEVIESSPKSPKSSKSLVIAIAQANAHLGDVTANANKLLDMRAQAARAHADCLATPEMFLSGYPADDLVLRDDFMQAVQAEIDRLARHTADGGPALIIGAPALEADQLYNSVFVLEAGKIQAIRHKVNLPNYGVFDDKRYFASPPPQPPIMLRDWSIGLAICEDIWFGDVCQIHAQSGADFILSLNASPFEEGKTDQRHSHARARITETALPFIYINMVGGQDELLFDGGSFALNRQGDLKCQLPSFTESLSFVKIDSKANIAGEITPPHDKDSLLWHGLVMAIRDYCRKNHFEDVVIGLSGGIDSALVAVLAVDALGSDHVRVVMMPSPYTAAISIEDAGLLADNLHLTLETIPIDLGMAAFDQMLRPLFQDQPRDVTEENIQSRLRGMILMALSNKCGTLVLSTGNKSEYATGYATLYGDMCGGFAPIKDLWKSRVFSLAQWRNQHHSKPSLGPAGEVIPNRIITRPPSAELRPHQQDTDSLPPYDVLDPILMALTEEMADIEEIESRGFDRTTTQTASALLFRAEYKRFQSAPGPKVTSRAFGRERRLPLTSAFSPSPLRESS